MQLTIAFSTQDSGKNMQAHFSKIMEVLNNESWHNTYKILVKKKLYVAVSVCFNASRYVGILCGFLDFLNCILLLLKEIYSRTPGFPHIRTSKHQKACFHIRVTQYPDVKSPDIEACST